MSFKFRLLALSLIALSVTPTIAFSATAYDLMTRDLSSSIKSLKSDTRFYHYFWSVNDKSEFANTTLKFADYREKYLDTRLNTVSRLFFTSNSTASANAGNGLYLAIDPHASSPEASKYYSKSGQFSKGFGDTMLEMTLIAGTKMINLENSNKIIIQPDTLAALASEGIGLDYNQNMNEPSNLLVNNRFSRDTVRYMARPGAEKFRELINKIFIDQQISLIRYSWQSSVSYFCDSSSTKLTSFVYIGNHGLDLVSSKTMVYWPEPQLPEMTQNETQTYERSKLMVEAFTEMRPLEMIWTQSKDKAAVKQSLKDLRVLSNKYFTDEALTNDLKTHTFQCLD